jgi:surface antigen
MPRLHKLSRFFAISLLSLCLAVAGLTAASVDAQAGGRRQQHHHGGGNGAAVAAAVGIAALIGVGIIASQARAEERRRERDEAYYRDYPGSYYDQGGYDPVYDQSTYDPAYDGDTGEPYEMAACGQTRGYSTTVIIDGRAQTAYGTECRMPDGTWHRGPSHLASDY